MQRTITPFDPGEHHIYTQLVVVHPKTGTRHSFLAILDTGAPATEFVDSVLIHAGFMEEHEGKITIKKGMQSQKYGKLTFPSIEICGQVIQNFTAYVSRLDASWGIDALIGLDFFRKFDVTISYNRSCIITERVQN